MIGQVGQQTAAGSEGHEDVGRHRGTVERPAGQRLVADDPTAVEAHDGLVGGLDRAGPDRLAQRFAQRREVRAAKGHGRLVHDPGGDLDQQVVAPNDI